MDNNTRLAIAILASGMLDLERMLLNRTDDMNAYKEAVGSFHQNMLDVLKILKEERTKAGETDAGSD